jgi:hypothetical protein
VRHGHRQERPRAGGGALMSTPTPVDNSVKLKRLRDARYRYKQRILRSNEAFAKMSPAEKRVQIAKDVLTSLDAKRIVATTNTYLDAYSKKLGPYDEGYYGRLEQLNALDAQDELLNGGVQCSVCAIGSVFTCAVERMDKITVGEMKMFNKTDMLDYVGEFFSSQQLELMECTFECSSTCAKRLSDGHGRVLPEWHEPVQRAIKMGNGCLGAEARLRLIMTNVIANGGEFKP